MNLSLPPIHASPLWRFSHLSADASAGSSAQNSVETPRRSKHPTRTDCTCGDVIPTTTEARMSGVARKGYGWLEIEAAARSIKAATTFG